MSTRCPKCIAERALAATKLYQELPSEERWPKTAGYLRGALQAIAGESHLRVCEAHKARKPRATAERSPS